MEHQPCTGCAYHLPATNGCNRIAHGISCIHANEPQPKPHKTVEVGRELAQASLNAELRRALDSCHPPEGPSYPGGKLFAQARPERSALDTQVAGNHYKNFVIQPAEFITKNKIGFLEGCVIKRVCRWRAKDGVQDLHKAIHELQLLIELENQKS